MARIWQEGFESGLPHGNYLSGSNTPQWFEGTGNPGGPLYYYYLASGRNSYSQYALHFSGTPGNNYNQKILSSSYSELYFRGYVKITNTGGSGSYIFQLISAGTVVMGITNNSNTSTYSIYVRIGGSLTSVATVTLNTNVWYKIEFRIKLNSTTGAYEARIDDIPQISASGVNTGDIFIDTVRYGSILSGASSCTYEIDDIALNDTTGTRNNSWCGSGTIVALKPKGVGNKSQWTSSQGYAVAEDGTTTTNLEITGHGLATNDVIYNATRNIYSIVTKVDNNNLTTSTITGQTQGDIIILFIYQATISATSGTTTALVNLPGHNLDSYDVFVNTTRSNAIRRVIYNDGISLYNQVNLYPYSGSTISSQASGDSIKTFKVLPYAISNHYQAVNNAVPNPQYSHIQSGTTNQIDTFDMEELIADKAYPDNIKIITATVKAFVKEKGTGSQYQAVLRIDGADYTGATVSLIGGTVEYSTIFNNSPDTEAQFTLSEIDSIEIGVKVV